MVQLADSISENADKLAEAFSTMGTALDKTLNGSGGGGDDAAEDSEQV